MSSNSTEKTGAFSFWEPAPAKINLALHVTAQRPDGYHCLESLVIFTELGDRLGFDLASSDKFTASGDFAAALPPDPADNLIIKARTLLRMALAESGQPAPPVHIHLEKNLPLAAGIGGGSADAAAALRGLLRLWQANLSQETLKTIALQIGADVPMCLESRPLLARGIGEDIEVLTSCPRFFLVIANPYIAVSTPAVFRALVNKHHAPLIWDPTLSTPSQWHAMIKTLRNDLQAPAQQLVPEIGRLCDLLQQQDASCVRMSGSGATCFALFETAHAAQRAKEHLQARQPHWYFQATESFAAPS